MEKDKLKFRKEFKRGFCLFVLRIVKFIGMLNPKGPVAWAVSSQLAGSGTSILGSCLEGQPSSSKKEFINLFKSINEARIWLALLRYSGKCDKKEENQLLKETKETVNTFALSALPLKGKDDFGF